MLNTEGKARSLWHLSKETSLYDKIPVNKDSQITTTKKNNKQQLRFIGCLPGSRHWVKFFTLIVFNIATILQGRYYLLLSALYRYEN